MNLTTQYQLVAALYLLQGFGFVGAFQQHLSYGVKSIQPLPQPASFRGCRHYKTGFSYLQRRNSILQNYMQSNTSSALNVDNAENDENRINENNASQSLAHSNSDEVPVTTTIKKSKNKIKVSAAVISLLAAIATLVAFSGAGAWRYYLAGGICAAISHAVTTPVDVIKTRKQVDESMQDLSMIHSGLKIMKDDGGAKALLAGLGPTTFGYLFEGAVKFGIYEVLKPAVRSMLAWSAASISIPWINSKVLGFLISGGIAGAAASVMLCPMEALRIRLVAEPEFAAGGWVEGGLSMIRNEGVKGLWKSLPAMLTKQVPYTVTKNVSFDMVTTIAYSTVTTWGMAVCSKTKIIIPLISAMIAGVLSCISSQPGDMLLSVVNAHEGKGRTIDYANQIMKEEGIAGFFVGIRERFLHVGLIVTMQLLIYDFVKRLVGIAATGSV